MKTNIGNKESEKLAKKNALDQFRAHERYTVKQKYIEPTSYLRSIRVRNNDNGIQFFSRRASILTSQTGHGRKKTSIHAS